MASVSFKEREHWQKLISKRIDQRIDVIIAKEDPLYLKRLDDKARTASIKSLGLTVKMKRLEKIKQMELVLREEKDDLEVAMAKQVLDVTSADSNVYRPSSYRVYIDAIGIRATSLRAGIMEKSPIGRKILALNREKDNLPVTVGAATSTAQIKSLWTSVNEVLKMKATELEKRALRLDPMDLIASGDND